jgi:hypothetical protein
LAHLDPRRKEDLRGLVLAMARSPGYATNFPIHVAGYAEECDTKEDNSGPTQQH